MASVEKLTSLLAKLKSKEKEAKTVSVIVGYTAGYAVHVHEDTQMFHRNGQAKFLETPARQLNNDGTLKNLINDALRQGKTLPEALLIAGLRLQRESQKLVPVLTGNLRASAFTRISES